MRAESAALLAQATADAYAARDAPTPVSMAYALSDVCHSLAQVSPDDDEAMTHVHAAMDVVEQVYIRLRTASGPSAVGE